MAAHRMILYLDIWVETRLSCLESRDCVEIVVHHTKEHTQENDVDSHSRLICLAP